MIFSIRSIFFLLFFGTVLASEEAHDLFLKAENHRNNENFREAILGYQQRLLFQEDLQEYWYSKYMLGVCHEKLGNWKSALFWYLEAFQSDPFRSEPLLALATHYRIEGKNDLGYLFAHHGKNVSPHDPLLDVELTISSYYTPFKEEGLIAADRAILSKELEGPLKDQTYRNIVHYVAPLEGFCFQPIECELPLIQEGFEERYHPMNPSLVKCEGGYKLICRSVNYTQTGAKHFQTSDPTGVFRTRNFLLSYDEQFKLLSQLEIIEQLPRKRVRHFSVEGLEDCRLFFYEGSLWFTCTTFDTNPGIPQISLCKLSDTPLGNLLFVEKLTPLEGPNLKRCEKNWLPFSHVNQLYMVYSCDPFILNQPDVQTGRWNPVLQRNALHRFSSFRGSAAPIEFDDGYLMLIHEVVVLVDFQRVYLHRFVQLDREMRITHLSKPFIFKHRGIEFCLSMVIDHKKKELVLPIGIEDHEAFFCFLDLDQLRANLESIP